MTSISWQATMQENAYLLDLPNSAPQTPQMPGSIMNAFVSSFLKASSKEDLTFDGCGLQDLFLAAIGA